MFREGDVWICMEVMDTRYLSKNYTRFQMMNKNIGTFVGIVAISCVLFLIIITKGKMLF